MSEIIVKIESEITITAKIVEMSLNTMSMDLAKAKVTDITPVKEASGLIKSEPDNLKEIKLDVLYQLKAYHEAATVTESNLDKAIFHREACNELTAIIKRAK